MNIIDTASKSIQKISSQINNLSNLLNEDFVKITNDIYNSKGRVIVTGIGKSAIIASKIVATMNSTGTPAVFMHAADAIHGDLGIIQPDDIVICISKSGNTPEIKVLVPLIKNFGNKFVAMVSNTDSFLAKNADYIINTYVDKEVCPNNLAPTSSTTAQLVMGDALAICLLQMKDFTGTDFAKYHPGGALGKQLYLTVGDLYINNERPFVRSEQGIREIILEISAKRLGAAVVLDDNDKIIGIITDGDLRRMMEQHDDVSGLKASDIMGGQPKTVESSELAVNALQMMKENSITQIIVAEDNEYLGVVHIHDIMKEGIV